MFQFLKAGLTERIEMGNERYGSIHNDDRKVCAHCGAIVMKKDAIMVGSSAICGTCAKKPAAELARI